MPSGVEIWSGAFAPKTHPRAVLVDASGYPGYAHLDRPLTVTGVRLISMANDNARFRLVANVPDQPTSPPPYAGPPPWSYLALGGSWQRASSLCGRRAEFALDRARALELANRLAIGLEEREPLDTDLTYTWSIASAGTLGTAIPLRLTVTNEGGRRVGVQVWDPVQFAFDGASARRATRGELSVRALAPGASLELAVDVRDHVVIERAGVYTLDVRFPSQLVKDAIDRGYDHADVWDIAPATRATIAIRES